MQDTKSIDIPSTVAGPRPIVALGEFDGFHRGHRWLMEAAAALSARWDRPLAAVVLDDGRSERLTATGERELALLRSGAQAVRTVPVSSDALDTALELVDFLLDELPLDLVVMSCPPEADGLTRQTDLRGELRRRGVELVEVQRWSDADGRAVTSAAVAAAVRSGEVRQAANWLGAPYRISGEVAHGNALGRTIGFPTANVPPPSRQVIPGNGVYSGTVRLADGTIHSAAINVGVRPTVSDSGGVLIEAHLLDFDGDLYGTEITVCFHERLRPETRFESLDALVEQLAVDVAGVRALLGS